MTLASIGKKKKKKNIKFKIFLKEIKWNATDFTKKKKNLTINWLWTEIHWTATDVSQRKPENFKKP